MKISAESLRYEGTSATRSDRIISNSPMESPETFFQRFVTARNALWRRHQGDLEKLQAEFCLDRHIYDNRVFEYEQERILTVTNDGTRAEITTNGLHKGKYAKRQRYVLTAVDGAWFVYDSQLECPGCRGTGVRSCSGPQCRTSPDTAERPGECMVCKGKGWISVRESVESRLDE
jgi:hypothetical protein